MTNPAINLLKNLHCKMGYPLAKTQQRMQMLVEKLNEPGSPTRHLRRIKHKCTHPGEALARQRAARPFTARLDPDIAARAKEISETGFAPFTKHIDPALLHELTTHYHEVLSKRSATAAGVFASHPFFFPLLNDKDLTTDSILVRFALQDNVLKAVAKYFGTLPYLYTILVMESRGLESAQIRASQHWHLDYSQGGDDLLSLWIYLTDVDGPDQGPFTYIPIPGSKKVKNDFLPRRIRDEEIENTGLAGEVKHALGPCSTAFFVNTTKCYHMGSRLVPGQKRVVYLAQFVRPIDERNIIKVTTPVAESKVLLVNR